VGRVPGPPTKELPTRRPRISRDFLEDYRRRRYVDATAELLHEFGRQGPSVTNIVRLAGTARNSFYEVFSGAEDCIAYGIDLAATDLFATLEAQDGEGEWTDEVGEAIAGSS
jgi:AcrR family transcriptional regulator